MGIANPVTLIMIGITLILATVSVFVHALWRARAEVSALQAARQRAGGGNADTASTLDDEESRTELRPDATEAAGAICDHLEQSASESLEDEKEIEMTDLSSSSGARCGAEQNKSAWQIFGLCAAEMEGQNDRDGATTSQTRNGEVSVLLAKLKKKDAEIARLKKDAEIARKPREERAD